MLTTTIRSAACACAIGLAAPVSANVTLINVFEVPKGQLATVITAWEEARDFLAEQPGYLGTALHQSLAADARFRLVNIANWTSPQAYTAAVTRMRDAGVFPRIEGLGVNPSLYEVVRTDRGLAQ